MEKMTLSRALRYKKRVVETIRRLETDIQTYNSRLDGTEVEVDIRKAIKDRQLWVEHLVDLKLKLQEATRPIQRLVLELAEAKSEISFWQKISVNNGKMMGMYDDKPTVYFAEVKKTERDQSVINLQKRIDQLQTNIDAFNATNTIEIQSPEAAV